MSLRVFFRQALSRFWFWFAVANLVADPSSLILRGQSSVRESWAIGTNHPGGILPVSLTYSELGEHNNANDRPPGQVTRLPGDPSYLSTTNPGADDDYYFGGLYPSGFNGLTSSLVVPNDEPWKAWERSLTLGDRTNRLHFVLASSQVSSASTLRLRFEFSTMGSSIGGVAQPSYGEHDLVIRFKNATGTGTVLYSDRIRKPTNLVLSFTAEAVAATPGANSIEFIRVGPAVPGSLYWMTFDFVLLEVRTVSVNNFSIDAGVIAGGGGYSDSAGFSLMGTVGEPGAGGHLQDTRVTVNPGFWFVIGGISQVGARSLAGNPELSEAILGQGANSQRFLDRGSLVEDGTSDANGLNRARITEAGDGIEVTFVGLPQQLYEIQFMTDTLQSAAWQDFTPPAVCTAASDGVVTFVDRQPAGLFRLYRARQIP